MCCMTHSARDITEKPPVSLMAETEEFRCQCKYGTPCKRRMTQEDFLCDWCRGRDHNKACLGMQDSEIGDAITGGYVPRPESVNG